jgi:hypothetical protein
MGKKQGASTITQQVAKNFLLSAEQTYDRKIKEALIALRIESAYSKDKILALRQGGEIGRLVDRQLVDGLAEVIQGCRRDAVQVAAGDDGAEENLVEVELTTTPTGARSRRWRGATRSSA